MTDGSRVHDPLDGADEEFDLPGNERAQDRIGRIVAVFVSLAFLTVLAVWVFLILPLFFQAPHVIPLCGRAGSCVLAPSWGYYPILAYYTFVFAVVPSPFLYLAGPALFTPRGADRMVLGSASLTFHYPGGRSKSVRWSSPRLRLELLDQRAPSAFDSKLADAPLTVRYAGSFHRVVLTEDAFDSILERASSLGLTSQRSTPEGRLRRTEVGTIRYRIRPHGGPNLVAHT